MARCKRERILKPFPPTPALLNVARRVVWFQEPEETLSDPVQFLAHLMTYGTIEDLAAVDGMVGPEEFAEALRRAPRGVFDGRSWAYWHLRFGEQPAPKLPARTLSVPPRR
jgi:hypothetical protein